MPPASQGRGGAAHAGEEGPPYPHSEDGRPPAHPLPTQSLSYVKKKSFPPLTIGGTNGRQITTAAAL